MKLSALLACLILTACQHTSDRSLIEADFVNASRPTRCAEEDNVYVQVTGDRVARFRIRAEHPVYIRGVREDSTAADFSHCDMSSDPRHDFEPRTVVLHDDGDIKLVGHTFASFWRPTRVSFRVLDRHEPGLHLIQLIRRSAHGEVEQLVVYPADGYWRLKPMPPASLPDTAYGSSFLFGPVEEDGRPFVAIRELVFDPVRVHFRIRFGDDRVGTLKVVETSTPASVLELTIDPPLPAGKPFAALRSMFVSTSQADVSVAAWSDALGAREQPVIGFDRFRSNSAWFGRREPSLHNLTAPDFVFGSFERSKASAASADRQP